MAASKMTGEYLLRIRNAKQVVQICRNRQLMLKGSEMKNIAVVDRTDNSGVSIIVDNAGIIADVCLDIDADIKYSGVTFRRNIDATGKCVIPGLVDAHTHPVWAGDRVHEFAMKLAGATYLEVHEKGGGIHHTVDKTHEATKDYLLSLFMNRLRKMLRHGTTLLEAKSGYGLDTQNEIKMLEVIESGKSAQPIEISSTYCGAHTIPKSMSLQEASNDVIANQIPALKELIYKGELNIDNIDVFCEKGVFDIVETRKILKAGVDIGLNINFHGDELNPTNSAELAAELNSCAVSHLEEISPEGIQAIAKSSTIAILLPTTAYILRLKRPPARLMLEKGVAIALGSDFNPNAYCMNMPMVMHLACVLLNLSMEEALVASTINAAAALKKSDKHGSLEPGKYANLLILAAERWEHLIYQFGETDSMIETVVIRGCVVYESNNSSTHQF
ncbi:Imidazolonepropionase [Oopsacas minuta]|uniref:Probable imidazolonepropionase n=1 Tax=Oopsacas minuta TaxID=111878 RepID=A0AAV7JSI1_9METZ|nr:Imidazolonepropionase [Oopsacas minuta]